MPHTNKGADEGAEETQGYCLRVVTEDVVHTSGTMALTTEQHEVLCETLEKIYDSTTLTLWSTSGTTRSFPTSRIKYVDLVPTGLPAQE